MYAHTYTHAHTHKQAHTRSTRARTCTLTPRTHTRAHTHARRGHAGETSAPPRRRYVSVVHRTRTAVSCRSFKLDYWLKYSADATADRSSMRQAERATAVGDSEMLGEPIPDPAPMWRGEPVPGADVAGASPVPVQMWQGRAHSSPSADVAGPNPAKSGYRCGRGRAQPSPGRRCAWCGTPAGSLLSGLKLRRCTLEMANHIQRTASLSLSALAIEWVIRRNPDPIGRSLSSWLGTAWLATAWGALRRCLTTLRLSRKCRM